MTVSAVRSAMDICQDLLDRTTDALMSGDPKGFVPHYFLPHTVDTHDQSRILETEDQLILAFKTVCDDFRAMGVTDLVRICVAADFVTPDEIRATHVVHWMSGEDRIVEPFSSYSILRRQNDQWGLARTEYGIPPDTRLKDTLDQIGVNKPKN